MTQETSIEAARTAALEKSGRDAGEAASSWVLDGNSSREDARALLRAIEDCELDYPSPLSGEYADGWTFEKVYFDAGLDRPQDFPATGKGWETDQDERQFQEDDELRIWEDAFSEGYSHEAERLARFYADIITAEIGTSGQFETIELEDEAEDLRRAVELEHSPCSDDSCDIREANEEGYPYVAAYLLEGATETPLLDAVVEHYGVRLERVPASEEFKRWTEHVAEFGVECPSCSSFTFGGPYNKPETCGNCGEDLGSFWSLLEHAPKGCEAVSDLFHWSTNYDAGRGPASLFLDLIGWSEENLGEAVFAGEISSAFGYLELDKLGLALREYADRPQEVRAYVETLIAAETR